MERLVYTRIETPDATHYKVTSDAETPETYVRRQGKVWKHAKELGSWWGAYPTRDAAARAIVAAARIDRDRARAYAALDGMGITTTFDQATGPLSTWSYGAEWCLSVWTSAREAWEADNDADDDTAWGCADAATPVGTHDVWQIWSDITAYASDHASDLGKSEGESATSYAMSVLFDLARDAMGNLFDKFREEATCGECGEWPCECTGHVDYPHEPGRLPGCVACESECHCTGQEGDTECVFCASVAD